MTDAPATVELRGVARRYAGNAGLHPTSVAFEPGATTVILGPSGCGKSTLLRLVNGLVQPDAGEVWALGCRVDGDSAPALRRRMGYVIQDGGLFPHRTALDNVAMLPRWLGWDAARIRARVDALCDLARLPRRVLAQYPQRLSGGERQRVALVRALMTDPALLLLDEPLGALDPMVRAELQRDLRAMFEALGKTVLLVTHDLAEAQHFAHAVLLLRDGRVLQHGALDALTRAPANPFVTDFLSAHRSLWGAP